MLHNPIQILKLSDEFTLHPKMQRFMAKNLAIMRLQQPFSRNNHVLSWHEPLRTNIIDVNNTWQKKMDWTKISVIQRLFNDSIDMFGYHSTEKKTIIQ